MIQEFITQNYLIIQNNVVTNVTVWNGNTAEWSPPAGSLALIQSTTPAMLWTAVYIDSKITDYVLTEQLGRGEINYTWDGTSVTTNEPKPVIPT